MSKNQSKKFFATKKFRHPQLKSPLVCTG